MIHLLNFCRAHSSIANAKVFSSSEARDENFPRRLLLCFFPFLIDTMMDGWIVAEALCGFSLLRCHSYLVWFSACRPFFSRLLQRRRRLLLLPLVADSMLLSFRCISLHICSRNGLLEWQQCWWVELEKRNVNREKKPKEKRQPLSVYFDYISFVWRRKRTGRQRARYTTKLIRPLLDFVFSADHRSLSLSLAVSLLLSSA